MKKIMLLACFSGLMILFVGTGCTKELPGTGAGIIINPPPDIINPPPANHPPVANAGIDFTGILYSPEMTLRGIANDQDGNLLSTTWTKIAGPACNIISPQNLTTPVTNLSVGDYQFELLVKDSQAATGRDTVAVKITSIEQITSPVNLFNLGWSCPMGCTIPIYNIYSHLPSNTPIRVFLKFVNAATWHEAAPISQYLPNNLSYYYEVDAQNTILLYTDYDMNTNVDVRITF